MRHRYIPIASLTSALALLAAVSVGCETSKAERSDSTSASPQTPAMSERDAQALVERAETMRDRHFQRRPALEAVASSDDLPGRGRADTLVRDERALLVEQLFGAMSEPTEADALAIPPAPHEALARFDPDKNRVLYVSAAPDRERLEVAIIAALVDGIDAQQFDAMPRANTWDAFLARSAARQATLVFATAQHLLDAHYPGVNANVLASRPELAAELPLMGDWLAEPEAGDDPATTIAARQRAFVARAGWTLAAGLYRSSGWSGIELARLTPPTSSADIVRPDQWMTGEPTGDWTWPEADDGADPASIQAGKVGPAITAMWLEDVIAAPLARTVYAGYVSDAYRFFATNDERAASFEWLSLWDTPASAQQVARAFERRLRARFADVEDHADHFVVFAKGLEVGVIISTADEDAKRERAQRLLAAHKVELTPRDKVPTTFVPTRRDELVAAMNKATLDARQWSDPATNMRLDLSALGDAWKVQQPDHGPVRWFARHDDGALLQLTAELANPLGASFASDAYREQLLEAFKGSIDESTVEKIAPSDAPPARGLEVRISGRIDGHPRTLHLWQFRRGDLILTYSLQTPTDSLDEHHKIALSLLKGAHELRDEQPLEPTEDDSGSSGGTIEYQIEDE